MQYIYFFKYTFPSMMYQLYPKRAMVWSLLFLTMFVGRADDLLAKEGMWLPPTIDQRAADMKKMGLQIPVSQLYNENGTGFNNAVVLFGKGCTGELISGQGLVLTNHHCGYGTVQGLSSAQNDYFAQGFWAMNRQEEIPCPGLTVTFVRKMENVSANILSGLPDTMDEASRNKIITVRIANLEKGYKATTGLDAAIKPYFNGNQYWVSLTETYTDVRLVGFPPNGIGQFGGDTDNWMWPRHTGDFSLFRVYADKGNKPAKYAKTNLPYKPKNFFTINAGGYKEGDFTMVYGFPGATLEYITSYQLKHIASIIDPIRIEARTRRLNAWNTHMTTNRDVFLKYTSKRAGIANGWKKWQGEVRGLRINNVMGKKQEREYNFQTWAAANTTLPYADNLLPGMQASAVANDKLVRTDEYIKEAVYGIEVISQSAVLDKMLQYFRKGYSGQRLTDSLNKLAAATAGFYKNYDAATDKAVFQTLMPYYVENNMDMLPRRFATMYAERSNSYDEWADHIFTYAMAANKEKLWDFAATATAADSTKILADPAWQLYNAANTMRQQRILPGLAKYNERLNYNNRLYMKAQVAQNNTGMLYPDANLTLRITYGQVKGIDPDGPAPYSYQTNLNEVISKNNPEVEEFHVPMKLIDLHANKNYGRWAVNGTVPVAFIATNHTTGGNSGSPVLNAKGQLIGTNFDRIWEGTMSDLYFDPNLCRNISLDIRYTLFVIEKFGGAGWLLKEMKIVNK